MTPPKHIMVITGDDPALEIDLTAFRTVRAQTGVPFTRLKNPTFNEFSAHLRRMRMQRGAPGDVHLALHMNPTGAKFADREAVTPDALSEVLSGVNVLFLAGCESAAIGDLLGVVPAVVTLLEKVDNGSARDLTELFWLGICQGYEAQEAYDAALERLPDTAEYAYLHVHNSFLAAKMAG